MRGKVGGLRVYKATPQGNERLCRHEVSAASFFLSFSLSLSLPLILSLSLFYLFYLAVDDFSQLVTLLSFSLFIFPLSRSFHPANICLRPVLDRHPINCPYFGSAKIQYPPDQDTVSFIR